MVSTKSCIAIALNMVDTCKTPTRVGGAEVFAAKILGSCIKKHYYRHCGPFHKVLNLLQKQKKRFQNFHLKCWICAAVHGHEHIIHLQGL